MVNRGRMSGQNIIGIKVEKAKIPSLLPPAGGMHGIPAQQGIEADPDETGDVPRSAPPQWPGFFRRASGQSIQGGRSLEPARCKGPGTTPAAPCNHPAT